MAKFFDLTFNTKEVIYIVVAVSSYIFALTKIDTRQSLVENRVSNIEKQLGYVQAEFKTYQIKQDGVNAQVRDNLFKIVAVLPKETQLELE
jgi:hypothetical protein